MLDKFKGFIAGTIFFTIITAAAPLFADTIDMLFNNIKIIVDNKEVDLKDAQGNKVTPILYNGTNYLPLRAISQALGKEVNWDSKTGNVYIGCKIPQTSDRLIISSESVNNEPIDFSCIPMVNNSMGYYTRIEKNIIGTPELVLVATNGCNKDIEAFEFTCSFTDAFDRPVNHFFSSDPTYKGVVQEANLSKWDESSLIYEGNNWEVYRFNLVLYDLAKKIDVFSIRVTKVKFEDGTEWNAK